MRSWMKTTKRLHAAESDPTGVDGSKRSTNVEQHIRTEGGETRRRRRNPTKAGGDRKSWWQDAPVKDAPTHDSKESTAQRSPECAPDANCQNAAVSEMAGKAGRAARPRAEPDASGQHASVSWGQKPGQMGAKQRRWLRARKSPGRRNSSGGKWKR